MQLSTWACVLFSWDACACAYVEINMSFGNLHQHLCGILLIDNLNMLHMQVNNVLMLVQNIMELDVFPPNLTANRSLFSAHNDKKYMRLLSSCRQHFAALLAFKMSILNASPDENSQYELWCYSTPKLVIILFSKKKKTSYHTWDFGPQNLLDLANTVLGFLPLSCLFWLQSYVTLASWQLLSSYLIYYRNSWSWLMTDIIWDLNMIELFACLAVSRLFRCGLWNGLRWII